MDNHSSFDLTAYQRDVWAANSHFPDLPQFNVFIYDRIVGELSDDLIALCLQRAVRRNASLRLRIAEQDGIPRQWLDDRLPAVDVVDLSGEPDPATACHDWLAASFDTAFIAQDSALVQLTILRESSEVVYVHVKSLHIVNDAWSLNLIMQQVRADLAQYRRSATFDDLASRSYRDVVDADAQYRTSPQHGDDEEYFRRLLEGYEPALYHRRDPAGERRSARHSFYLQRSVLDQIRSHGYSVFAFFTSALSVYLTRAHLVDDVCIGVPLLNRPTPADRETVGHYANTLPVRVQPGAGQTFTELVAAVQAQTRELKKHERLAFGDLLAALPRGAGGPRRLFDVTVAYLKWPATQPIPGLSYSTVVQARAHDDDVLGIVVNELDDEGDVRVDLDYGRDVFSGDYRIADFSRHLHTLVVNALAMMDRPASGIPMMAAPEHHQVVVEANATRAEYPDTATLHGVFGEQAARTPDAVAIVDDATGARLTYAELDRAAGNLATLLQADGVVADQPVAILIERSPSMMIAILAVLMAGGAYLPVDPSYPAERIGFILQDSGARILLTSSRAESTVAAVRALDATGLLVRDVDDSIAIPGEPVRSLAGSRNLAYVIYTSGSTGKPKGVLIEHRSAINRLHWMNARYRLTGDDVLIQKTPTSFDVSVWELFWWMFAGARMVLLAPGAEKDPRELAAALDAHGVSVVHFVPSMLDPFLDVLATGSTPIPDRLRYVFCSGEALAPEQVRRFSDIARSGARLVNLYGPTEATVDVSYFDCPDLPGSQLARVPIGRPIDNTELHVLDRHGLVQPVGLAGELHIAGVGVARGYLNRPELTQARFVPNPHSDAPVLYRTGDLVVRAADGELVYLGRLDSQVKIRGNRIEMGEVQAAIAALPGIRSALVTQGHRPDGGAFLIGYFVGEPHLGQDIRQQLGQTLPDFMIPAYLQPIDSIPLTANGKADLTRLPVVTAAGPSGGHDRPRTELEIDIAAAWQQVLGVSQIGVHDNYFAVGGDSITMLQIRAEAEKRGVRFSLADLIRNPTVAELSKRAVRSDGSMALPATLAPFALVPDGDRALLGNVEDAYPATTLQVGLLFHSAEQEGSAVYHDVFAYTLRMPWDEVSFTAAFHRLANRHPVLRSSFELGSFSRPLQVISHRVSGGLDIADLRDLPEHEAQARIAEHIEQRRYHRYDFDRAPLYLFRAHVLADSVVLVFSFHHAILDGWSVATLVRELLQDHLHLAGAAVDPVGSEPRLTPAYYVQAEQEALANEESSRFWADRLAGAEPVQIDGLRPYSAPEPAGLLTLRVELPAGLERAARAVAHSCATPLKSVFLAAHCALLQLLSGSPDVTTGLVTGGRPDRGDAERTSGLFLATLPVRLNGKPVSWAEAVRLLHVQEQEHHDHRRYPLSAIQQDNGGRVPFDTAFNFVSLRMLGDLLKTAQVELLDFRTWEETNFHLLLNAVVDPVDDRVWLRFDLDARLFSRAQAEQLTRIYLDLLTELTTDPDRQLSFESLITPPSLVLAAAPTETVLAEIERQAMRHPEATAVLRDATSWSYRQLWQAAGRIARGLVARGASPGERVGLAMERSPETIAALLGVARAGCACVPLDVTYPADRIDLMIERSDLFAVIASPAHVALTGRARATMTIGDLVTESDPDLVLPEVSIESTAYILFTSGSTGVPKGVEIPHRVLANYARWQADAPSGARRGVTLQFAPLSFDVSFQEILSTLYVGGALQLIDESDRHDMPALLRLLDRNQVQRAFLPYVALQQLAEASVTLGIRPRALNVVISSGEQLRVTEEIRTFCAGVAGTLLENQYGPTETHLLTSYPMSGDPQAFPELPPIGTPIDGIELLLLDEHLRPVPDGAKAELYATGICLADGYFRQPELTEQRFLPHPDRPGERLYRTGDLARRLPDGHLVWLGRADSQVKVRGFRVEVAEVELAIRHGGRDQVGLQDVAVVARRRANGSDAYLVAFLSGDAEQVDLDLLRSRLRSALPGYMVPSYFEWLDAFPRTASGKRDDAALARLPLRSTAVHAADEPADQWELSLLQLAREVLENPGLGLHDDFFDSGGTSLSAMRLAVLIEKRFEVELRVSALISAPTMSALARRVRDAVGGEAYDPLTAVQPGGDRPPIFLVHPLGGNVLCYLALAKHLGPDQPVYAMQAPGGTAGSEPLSSVPELARMYIEAMRRAQPDGPYLIGGWSFGGFIAFEMARQLSQAGAGEVAGLVLIDPIAVEQGQRPDISDRSLLEWFFWELLWGGKGGATAVEAVPPGLDEQAAFDFVSERAAAAGVLPAGASAATMRRLFAMFKAHWHALLTYQPDPSAQDLLLLRATSPLPEVLRPMHGAARSMHTDPTNGWSALTDGTVTVVEVSGDHLMLLDEPFVAEVAEAIQAALQSLPAHDLNEEHR